MQDSAVPRNADEISEVRLMQGRTGGYSIDQETKCLLPKV
jgi:hypothetical protein